MNMVNLTGRESNGIHGKFEHPSIPPSIHCCLVVTCLERADLLDLVGDVYCIFVTFSCGILDQVWYLIVSFPDLCRLSYLEFHWN